MQKEEEAHEKNLQSKVRQMCNCFCCGQKEILRTQLVLKISQVMCDRPLEGHLRKVHVSNIVPVEYSSLKMS